jgi:hypothetical protein
MYTTLAILQALPAAYAIHYLKAWNLYQSCEELLSKTCQLGYYQKGQIISLFIPQFSTPIKLIGVFIVCLWLQIFALAYHFASNKFEKPPVFATYIGMVGAVSFLLGIKMIDGTLKASGDDAVKESVFGLKEVKILIATYVVPNISFGILHFSSKKLAKTFPILRNYGIV